MANVGERIIRGIGVVTVIAFIVITLTPVSNAIGQRVAVTSGEIQQADAIVVLGAGVMPMGVLTDESMRRLITGIELFKRGMAPVLVVSGPGRPDAPVPTEAAVRAKLAETMGIPPSARPLRASASATASIPE